METENYCSILKEYLDYYHTYQGKYGEKCIIFMLVGNFYEIYSVLSKNDPDKFIGPNLYELSDLLNVYIGEKKTKNHNFSMIGFPEFAMAKYRNILLNDNYTLVIVDQITPSPNPERAVVEIISPATIIDSYDKLDSHYLVSLYINLFTTPQCNIYHVGLSAIDISTGKNYVHSIQSTPHDKDIWLDETYRLIHYYSPKELLIHTEKDITFTKEDYIHWWGIQNLHLNSINKSDFLKISFQQNYLEKLFTNHSLLSIQNYLGFDNNYEITVSYLYMLEFIYEHKIENIKDIAKPILNENKNHLVLNNNCLYQLYVIDSNEHSKEKYSSLFSLLNQCSTSLGRRLLKERILYPILDIQLLQERYNEIHRFQEKLNEKYLYDHCIPFLKKILDIEKYHRKMNLQILHPQEFHNLHLSYMNILHISNILKDPIHQEIQNIKDDYSSYYNLEILRKFTLSTMTESVFQKGIHPELDNLQDEYNLNMNQLEIISNQLMKYIDKKTNDTIKILSTEKYGWLLTLTQNRGKTLLSRLKNLSNPEILCGKKIIIHRNEIQIIKRGAHYCLQIDIIRDISERLIVLQNKIQAYNREKYVESLLVFHQKYSHLWNKIVTFVSHTDLYSTIAQLSIQNSYCCPILEESDTSFISVKEIRHPLVEKIQNDIPYIPNDVDLNQNGILLYGTNACGKSTLMKSIGLSLIMAQAGFFVPCSSFRFSPYTQLFTRILNNDNLFKGQSSFAIEMSELRNIQIRANDKSLILGDELCSGTEISSAIAIVSAGIKTLSDRKCSFIFTSHLHQLMTIQMIQSIQNLQVKHLKIIYDSEKNLLIYDRKLEDGSGPAIYGLEVCKAMDLGNEFISLAREVQLEISQHKDTFINLHSSVYNSKIKMDLCQICSKNAEHCHHIKEQQEADENGMIENFHKNSEHNLVPLCESCHHKVHHGNLRIHGYHMTNEGKKLNYEYIESSQIQKNKKFSQNDIDIILTYKDEIDNKTLKKSTCMNILKITHNIHISPGTFNKIISGKY